MLSKTDADAVRVHNRHAVIDHLRRMPSATRKDISLATGLSISAVSAIANALLRAGLLLEIDDEERGAHRGRPVKNLALNGAAARVAAAKIAVGEVAVRLCDYRGQTLGSAVRETDIAALSPEALVAALIDLLAEAGTQAEGTPVPSRIVVSVQGKTDGEARRIVWSPALVCRNIDIAGPLEGATGARVGVFNDCSLMPEAFRWNSDFVGRDFATLFIGAGVGMGLHLNGATFRGHHSSAVEFGHINHIPGGALCRCGNRGCIEAYAGDYAVWRRAEGHGEAVPTRPISDEEIHRLVERARGGEAEALQAYREAGTAIGYGLGRMFMLVDPLPIVFTGSGVHAMDILEPSIRAGISESAIDGSGVDVPFSTAEDVDALVFSAATAKAIAALDHGFAGDASVLASKLETGEAAA